MKLDQECVRDVLLTVEAQPYGKRLTLTDIQKEIPNYSREEIAYTCLKLSEGNLLSVDTIPTGEFDKVMVTGVGNLSFKGHEFLNTVRDEKVWSRTKEIAQKTGNFSLDILKTIAVKIAQELITGMF